MTELQFPIQIGLVGAPGSKKQEVAAAFAEISKDWFAENESELVVLANSGNLIEQNDDIAMGLLGGWSDDLRAYFKRFEAEEAARKQGVSWISLGTALDNMAHCGTNLENVMTGIQTPDQEERIQRYHVALTQLTFLFLERFRYLFGFYLPYEGTSIVLPGQPEPSTYQPRIDQALRAIFANFGLRIQELNQPTVEEKAQEIFATVKNIVENGVPELPPDAVRDEDGARFEDPGVDINVEEMSPEDEAEHHEYVKAVMADNGTPLSDWQPDVPQEEPATVAE